MMRRRRPVLGTVARTAVVAGTAQAVAGRVNHNQQQKWAAQEAGQTAPRRPRPPAARRGTGPARRHRHGREAGPAPATRHPARPGILTEAEFEAQKAAVLAS
jgi:hypothetical protein